MAQSLSPSLPPGAPSSSSAGPRAAAVRRTRGGALVSAALAMGLISGFFYAYACSVMIGLARLDDRTFIDTMQWINATVRNRWFAPSFFGALALTAAAVMVHLPRDGRRVLPWAVAALAFYGAAFGITLGVHVPLNDDLAAAGDPAVLGDPSAVRAAFEDRWVAWNAARTVASTAALACLLRALVLHGREAGLQGRPPRR
ncbi:anthrone oxygenase family protein [Streptomyces sp. NPDC006990]|uniref:anthrone oxygenase family protein n=1 Tax=Streptomyces sp. NPDC006990 TaxID=3154481 RepID=UPI003453C15A